MDITEIIFRVNQYVLNPLIGLLLAVAFLVFLWGLFKFISGAGDDEARETGKRHIVWGVLGIFIMLSVFGIIRLLLATFGIGDTTGMIR